MEEETRARAVKWLAQSHILQHSFCKYLCVRLCVRLFARSWGYTGEAGYVLHYPEIHKIELAGLSTFLPAPSVSFVMGTVHWPPTRGRDVSWGKKIMGQRGGVADHLGLSSNLEKNKGSRRRKSCIWFCCSQIKENACRKSYRFPFFFFFFL